MIRLLQCHCTSISTTVQRLTVYQALHVLGLLSNSSTTLHTAACRILPSSQQRLQQPCALMARQHCQVSPRIVVVAIQRVVTVS
eukprot:2139-Heterococcus_DN1.PRE.2